MTQRIAVLGATGSIGDSTLDILSSYPEQFEVYALSGHSRLNKLFELCLKHRPSKVCVPKDKAEEFSLRLTKASINCDVVCDQDGLVEIAKDNEVDTVVAAIVGAAGLASTLAAAEAGKRILLANKEALVMAGSLMMKVVRENGASLLPLDSEHNAIFQCLPREVQTNNTSIHQSYHGVRKLWLTASGGPFLNSSFQEMQTATVQQAVKHPNWSMGQKISVDSATMMNKGLELIEACHLFDLCESQINVVIHPQSIVHSMVEYCDGSFLAQMGSPDMRTPIAHALAYPDRIDAGVDSLNLFDLASLDFVEPDLQKFACLVLARKAMQSGQAATIVLNAANEVAVSAFINEQVSLTDIALINERVLDKMHKLHQHLIAKVSSAGSSNSSSTPINQDAHRVLKQNFETTLDTYDIESTNTDKNLYHNDDDIQISTLSDIFEIDSWARNEAEIEVSACRN